MPTRKEEKGPLKLPKVIEQLRGYTGAGVRVWIMPPRITGTIIQQGAMGAGATFLVELDKPVTFDEYVSLFHVREDAKGKVRQWFSEYGLIGKDGLIRRIWTRWVDLVVELKPGTLAEYTEHDPAHIMSIKTFVGRIVGVQDEVALFEVFEPVPFMRGPESIVGEAVRKGFYADISPSIGIDTYSAWKGRSPETLPPGQLSEDGMEYMIGRVVGEQFVQEVIPFEEVRKMCKKFYPQEPG